VYRINLKNVRHVGTIYFNNKKKKCLKDKTIAHETKSRKKNIITCVCVTTDRERICE
jgi:hypothetical protein